MPAMIALGRCNEDKEVSQRCLKWVILTCRSNFLLLPQSLKFKGFMRKDDVMCHQFMALTASPEQEMIFQQMKKKYGSRFLWHGSPTIRWHTIIREGLKNFTGNYQMTNVGQVCGPGIYFAPVPQISINYTRPKNYQNVRNRYKNSMFGEYFTVVSLVEVTTFQRSLQFLKLLESLELLASLVFLDALVLSLKRS